MTRIIRIPDVYQERRMGDVLLSMFSVINQTERSEGAVVWDYEGINYLPPFFLSALAVYKDSHEGLIEEINIGPELNSRFSALCFSSPVEFTDSRFPHAILEPFLMGKRLPICKFSRRYRWIDEMQSVLFSIVSKELRNRSEGWMPETPLSYLISELVCNIQEHSCCSYGYIIFQAPDEDDALSICVADNGITIHGSYMESGNKGVIRLIGDDHAEALRFSTKGVSTKQRPENESRGYGISTNLDMVVNGLDGEFFLLSGKAFYRSDRNGEQFVNLPEGMEWDGTIILVRVPLKQNQGFDVYKYIE